MRLKTNNKIAYVLIVLFVFLLYGNSITNGYSLDDHLINKKNDLTQHGLKGIPDIFKNYSFNDREQSFTYRPVLLVSFAVEYAFLGTNAHTSHFVNILLYATFGVLLFYFLSLVFPGTNYAMRLVTVFLFMAHPLHSEVVDNLKSRDELLAGLFGISMLIHFHSYLYDKKIYRLPLIIVFAVAGMLSKQSMLLYIGLVPFLFLHYFLAAKEKNWVVLASLFVTTFLGRFTLRSIKHNFLADPAAGRKLLFYENPLINASFFERVAAGLCITAYNFKLLLWPFDPLYYYGYNQVPLHGWTNILPYAGLLLLVVLLYLAIKYFRKDFFISLGAIILLLALLSVSNIVRLLPGIVADRFLYWGSLGFIMIAVSFAFKLFERYKWIELLKELTVFKPQAAGIVIVLLFAFSAKIISRNKVWKDEFTLISTDVVRLGGSAKAHDMYAYQLMGKIKVEQNIYKRDALIQEAIDHCSKSISVYPQYITCWNNLGTLYFARQQYAIAEAVFRRALLVDSTDANPLFNLGNICAMQNRRGPALFFYERALEKQPGLKDLISVYKQFILRNNKTDLGISFVEKLAEKHPENRELDLLLVDFYNTKTDYEAMLKYLQKAERLKHDEQLVVYIKNITTFISAKNKQ